MNKHYMNFIFNNIPLESQPTAGISLLNAKDQQPTDGISNRITFFKTLNIQINNVVAVRQKHSHTVYAINDPSELNNTPDGDGIITTNRMIVPTVVVADCMPVFLFDPISKCFGVLHSGWAGTGIVYKAILLAEQKYKANRKNFRIILGPHIRNCCYTIDTDRADYFYNNFGHNTVKLDDLRKKNNSLWPYKLSLAQANINILKDMGVPVENINDTELCTHCHKNNGRFIFGSHRRETANSKSNKVFTHMVSFLRFPVV